MSQTPSIQLPTPTDTPLPNAHSGEQTPLDSGLASLCMMAAFHGMAPDPDKLHHEYSQQGKDGRFNVQAILLAAKSMGITAKCVAQDLARLDKAPLPAIAVGKDDQFFILGQYDASNPLAPRLLIQHPNQPPSVMDLDAFRAVWSGELIYCTSKATFAGALAKFDFSWFIPAIVKYRKLLGEILIISLVLQMIGLVTPLFFQVVMDKVLVNNAITTLNVIAIGLICATVFDALLTGVRTWGKTMGSSLALTH